MRASLIDHTGALHTHENVMVRLYRLKGCDTSDEVELPNRTPSFNCNLARVASGAASAPSPPRNYARTTSLRNDGRTVIVRLHVCVYQSAILKQSTRTETPPRRRCASSRRTLDNLFQPEGEKPKRHYDQGFQKDLVGAATRTRECGTMMFG